MPELRRTDEDAMTNSRRKGSAGEREAAAAWRTATGLETRRGQQFSGGPDSPDIVIESGRFHAEVKRLSRIAALKALRQAEADASSEAIPFGLMREDGDTRWAVLVRLDQLVRLAEALLEERKEQP